MLERQKKFDGTGRADMMLVMRLNRSDGRGAQGHMGMSAE